VNFIFNTELRDTLLFDDEGLTFSRRYFWAYQTLGIISADIKSLIDAYEDSFTDDVWDGRHKSIWPMIDKKASRSVHWRKRMNILKKDFQKEIRSLEQLLDEYDDRRKEIMTLRDQLLAGTSVLQGRNMVEQASIIVLQAHNIKLFAFATILFLPLIFVAVRSTLRTSKLSNANWNLQCLFGMTNMPGDQGFRNFAIVIVSVCLPFYLLIGTLNGAQWWGRGILYRVFSFAQGRMARMGNRFDDSEFRHGKALDFPEIPGESQRNPVLSQIRMQYNKYRDADGNATPGDLGSRFDDSEFKHGKALNFPEIPGEPQRNSSQSQIRMQYNQYRDQYLDTDGNVTPRARSPKGNKIASKETPPGSTTGVQPGPTLTSESSWWDKAAGKQKIKEADIV
jgi:hypothetical protein